MKKIFSGLLYGIIIYSSFVSNAKAQMSLVSISSSKTKAITALTSVSEEKTAGDEKATVSKDNIKETKANLKAVKANLKAMKANFKATENFKKKFKDAPDVKWLVEEQVISASFNRDGIKTRVIYNKRGNWVHTISWCDENKMPKDITSLIRSNYPNYTITGMHEIIESDVIFYIVYLEDENSLKQITVYNGELNVYKAFTKE